MSLARGDILSYIHSDGLRLKRSLAQHFLIDKDIIEKIIHSIQIDSSDVILEIGAGLGSLTEYLCEKAAYVYAMEIDRQLANLLQRRLGRYKNLSIINRDILEYIEHPSLNQEGLKIVGNLPYNIARDILKRLIQSKIRYKGLFIMLQKEVAERITSSAGEKKYCPLSIFLQVYTKIKVIIKTIRRRCFFPVPKVDSTFLALSILENPLIPIEEEEDFFKLVKIGFSQRRKFLINTLRSKGIDIDRGRLSPPYRGLFYLRAEEVSLTDFRKIYFWLKENSTSYVSFFKTL